MPSKLETSQQNPLPYGCYFEDLAKGTVNLPPRFRSIREKGKQAMIYVLSGGGALSPINIGVTGALLEKGVPFDAVIGTSAGSIGTVVASYAQSLDAWVAAKQFGETINWKLIAQLRANSLKGMFNFNRMAEFIDFNLNDVKQKIIPDLDPTPMIVTTTEVGLRKMKTALFWDPVGNSWGKVVQASCSIPGIVEPTKIENQYYYDGSLIRQFNEPVDVAKLIAPEAMVISVRLTDNGNPAWRPKNKSDIKIEPDKNLSFSKLSRTQFHPEYVVLGYEAGLGRANEIIQLMYERGIDVSYRRGFKGVNLRHYFQHYQRFI